MGAQPSQPKRVVRSVSYNGSQRDVYLDFDVRLFKIDCEVRFTPELHSEKISEVKQKLYCLRREFDASKMKEKYEAEFKFKYRKVIETLEQRSQSSETQRTRRKSRKKRLAPLPPDPNNKQVEDLQKETKKTGELVASFHGRRDGNKYNKLHQKILSLLFKLTELQEGSDKQKYCMMKELLDMLKRLEHQALENDETAVHCD